MPSNDRLIKILRSRSKSPMYSADDNKMAQHVENGSSFKGKRKLLKTLSLFSSSLTPPEQRKSDYQNYITSSNLLKSSMPRRDSDDKRNFGASQCQDIHTSQDKKKEHGHYFG